jgi:serine/threonine protein kinase
MPSANQRISEYVLEERVGAGTFGEVWRARHHVWADQLVAIKIPTDGQYIRNLQREGAAIHGLDHVNIVHARGFDPYADPPYLVMEYVAGTSLRPLIAGRELGVADAVAIMKQVLGGLAHAHKAGIIHRDIKPENILIDERSKTAGFATPGVVKVTDFGLGKAATISMGQSIAFSASMNAEDAKRISGTLDYMAPEQRSGGEIDHRADLYACGVILYELLTGERPAGTDLPSDLNPKSPKYLDEVFRRSYARLEKRYASAEQFLASLSTPATPPPLPPPLPWQRGAETGRQCPSCRRAVVSGDQFCMHCGVQLVEWVLRCPQCGAYPDPADRFCIFCGVAVSQQTVA